MQTWYNQLASVGHYLHNMFSIPLGLLVIKSNSCQQTSMIWGNTGYEIVEIDLSFLKTKQDKLHQIRHNLNIYLLKIKKKIWHLNLAIFFMCKIVTMKFLSHFKKKLPIDWCFREILMQPHRMHRFVFLYNCTYFDVFVNTSTINFLKKSLLLSLWRMTCLFELYTIIPVFLTIIFGYKCLLT